AQLFGDVELVAQRQPDALDRSPLVDRVVRREAATCREVVGTDQVVRAQLPEGLHCPGLELRQGHLRPSLSDDDGPSATSPTARCTSDHCCSVCACCCGDVAGPACP